MRAFAPDFSGTLSSTERCARKNLRTVSDVSTDPRTWIRNILLEFVGEIALDVSAKELHIGLHRMPSLYAVLPKAHGASD